jgi:adenosylcobinamide-phosphate synthase
MDEAALSRSAIESASENGVDGVISPLFWTVLLGPSGLWAFKAASTLDSMVGYRTPAYETFGKVSARVDDFLNWVPARLALLLYSLSAFPKFPQMLRTFQIGWRDHHLHASPNSGWGEAAAAGFLAARLGGPAVYHGILKEKPWFGREFRDVDKTDILRTIRMVLTASIIFLLGIVLFLWYVHP